MARGSAHAADERSKTGSYVLNWAAACAVGPGGVRIYILTSGRDPRWVARAERSTYRNVRFRLLVACQVGEFVPLRARWRPLAYVLEVDSRRLTAVTEVVCVVSFTATLKLWTFARMHICTYYVWQFVKKRRWIGSRRQSGTKAGNH